MSLSSLTVTEVAAETAGRVPASRARRTLRGSLLANELRTMFRRNRNLVLLGALALIPVVALGIAR